MNANEPSPRQATLTPLPGRHQGGAPVYGYREDYDWESPAMEAIVDRLGCAAQFIDEQAAATSN